MMASVPESPTRLSLSSLLCQENEAGLDQENECFSSLCIENEDDDDEYIQILLQKEMNGRLQDHEFSRAITGGWTADARLNSVQYILSTGAFFGFKFQTLYLSVTYFDKFLSQRLINDEKQQWAVRLLAMACLSLAAKLEECTVPSLSELPAEEYNFESSVIERMELLVLNTLEWRMRSVTPYDYVHYFLPKFCQDSAPRTIMPIVMDIILAATRDVNAISHKPSVIAATAILVASAADQRLTREALEIKLKALPAYISLKIEDVYSCYNQMKHLGTEILKLLNSICSPPLTPLQLQRTSTSTPLENSSVTSEVTAKRKRLAFNDCDEKESSSNKKRQN